MSDWREIMGASAFRTLVKPTHNPQNPPVEASSADIADIADEKPTAGSGGSPSEDKRILATLTPSDEAVSRPAEWRAAEWRQGVTRNSRTPPIPEAVRAVIEAIEPEARRLGWPHEMLWNTSSGARPAASQPCSMRAMPSAKSPASSSRS
jgi:hypothetical protein